MEELKRFLLLAQQGNVTQSADELFITQPALTQSIHRLEYELQTKLFTRSGRLLALTDEGRAMIPIALKILSLWDKAKAIHKKPYIKPTITVGMFDNIALRLSIFLQHHFSTEMYNVELTIDSSENLFMQLQLGTLDMAICVTHPSRTVHAQNLYTFSETLLPVSSKRHADPMTVPFILYNKQSNTRLHIDTIFSKYNFEPHIFVESTSPTFMKELALLGNGAALLPNSIVREEIEEKKLFAQALPFSVARTCGLFIGRTSTFSLKHPFIKSLQEYLQLLTQK